MSKTNGRPRRYPRPTARGSAMAKSSGRRDIEVFALRTSRQRLRKTTRGLAHVRTTSGHGEKEKSAIIAIEWADA